jgi:hypothetical protein
MRGDAQRLHPDLTKYRTRSEIDAAFARFEAHGGFDGPHQVPRPPVSTP